MKVISYHVTYDNGYEKTLEVQTESVTAGYRKVLGLARKGHPRTREWEIVRIEFVEVIEG